MAAALSPASEPTKGWLFPPADLGQPGRTDRSSLTICLDAANLDRGQRCGTSFRACFPEQPFGEIAGASYGEEG